MPIKVQLFRPYFDSHEIQELKEVLASGWVTSGPKVKDFETKVAKYIDIKYSISVTNCTAALHLSLLSMGIKHGDEVLVSDFTYPATGHAVMYCGARPVFIDIKQDSYNIDPNCIEKKITKKTKAIIPVHAFGQPADMDRILKIADDNNLYVIEDAACALGAKYDKKFAGTLGDIGCLSFHARKGITTGEGGMVVTNNKKFADKIRALSLFGIKPTWNTKKKSALHIDEFIELGYNYKMSDITAAVGIGQMKKINTLIKRRRQLAKYWDEKLSNFSDIIIPYSEKRAFHIYQSYVVMLDDKIPRNKLIIKLQKKGIQTQIGTYASHIQPVYNSSDKCPNSLKVYNHALALPLFYSLTEDMIDYSTKILKQTIGDFK